MEQLTIHSNCSPQWSCVRKRVASIEALRKHNKTNLPLHREGTTHKRLRQCQLPPPSPPLLLPSKMPTTNTPCAVTRDNSQHKTSQYLHHTQQPTPLTLDRIQIRRMLLSPLLPPFAARSDCEPTLHMTHSVQLPDPVPNLISLRNLLPQKLLLQG